MRAVAVLFVSIGVMSSLTRPTYGQAGDATAPITKKDTKPGGAQVGVPAAKTAQPGGSAGAQSKRATSPSTSVSQHRSEIVRVASTSPVGLVPIAALGVLQAPGKTFPAVGASNRLDILETDVETLQNTVRALRMDVDRLEATTPK
jgi:hypothetical protein